MPPSRPFTIQARCLCSCPFAWTAAYTCIGYLLGRFLRTPVIVVGAVVLAYIAPLVLAGTPDVRPALYSFVDDGAVSPPIFLSAHTLATQLGLIVAVSVAVGSTLLVTLRAFGPRLATPMYAVVAAALLSCIGLTIFGSHNRRYEASGAAGGRVCRASHQVPVCVWSDHRRLLEPSLRAEWLMFRARYFAPSDASGMVRRVLHRPIAGQASWFLAAERDARCV
jgi:hypothetical protein